jgi:hypothetical protein
MKNRINVFFSINNLLFEVAYLCNIQITILSGALSGTVKMLATDELDRPYLEASTLVNLGNRGCICRETDKISVDVTTSRFIKNCNSITEITEHRTVLRKEKSQPAVLYIKV